ncbi:MULTISPECIES: heme exporter protein CcmB [Legionella]|uniref:Heme exporter protein B n=1 Tax=Legionella septentrionalis TaxID=2498109 RepID=A0A433JH31_9GAMM|nr:MULTISPECIES: heme exporter protein CcmB [Legionella]MCP0914666.1 heme exporter protein CcmB [Legionella sp. 27cVA30]RUQ81617.1 heme exporter protein CcmB [Legionella septentrionalis]RUQ95761.1 heme exporter protein CcmB [Legionella septentrionalis]RUR09158.1 heme exporter protein CcmB [Legionella septentrionalis]RUR15656.1 heme exporter protein CcmB [Legionella septentrionalis]
MSLATLFKTLLLREAYLHLRQLRLIINSFLFFCMVMVFFPLTIPPDPAYLRIIAPGIVWIGLLLAALLSAERLFQQDFEDGVIEQWLISGYPVSLFVSAKILLHWLLVMLPLIVFSPVLAILFSLNAYETAVLVISLICGSPAIMFLCALAAIFSTGLKQKGVLMALVLLPLTIPVMIFGSGTLNAAMQGLPVAGFFALLLALSLIAAGFLPFAIAAVMRITLVD